MRTKQENSNEYTVNRLAAHTERREKERDDGVVSTPNLLVGDSRCVYLETQQQSVCRRHQPSKTQREDGSLMMALDRGFLFCRFDVRQQCGFRDNKDNS